MLATVDVPQDEGCEGGSEGGEAEDEHRGLVGRIGLVGLTNEHRDDGTAEVLDEEDHRVGGAETFQRDDLRYTRPEGGRSQGVANAEDDHQGDGCRAAVHGQREAEVDGGEHQCPCDDEGDAFAITVVDESEERRHKDGAEGGYR